MKLLYFSICLVIFSCGHNVSKNENIKYLKIGDRVALDLYTSGIEAHKVTAIINNEEIKTIPSKIGQDFNFIPELSLNVKNISKEVKDFNSLNNEFEVSCKDNDKELTGKIIHIYENGLVEINITKVNFPKGEFITYNHNDLIIWSNVNKQLTPRYGYECNFFRR